MEMNQIRYFMAVCEHRNFTHAARALNVSQPSLTTAIKKLEGELGGLLFLRDRAGCRLTPLGEIVYPRLQDALQQTHQATADAIRHTRLKGIPISVGIGETIGHSRIIEAVARYRARIPKVDIELIVDEQQALLGGLREGRFDIAITAIEASYELYHVDPLYNENYRTVVSASHPLAQNDTVALDVLADNEMLDRINCEMRETLYNTCADRGSTLFASCRSNHVDWLLELARLGKGFLILPDTAIPHDKDLVSLTIEGVTIKRQVLALRYLHQPTRPEARELLKELARIS